MDLGRLRSGELQPAVRFALGVGKTLGKRALEAIAQPPAVPETPVVDEDLAKRRQAFERDIKRSVGERASEYFYSPYVELRPQYMELAQEKGDDPSNLETAVGIVLESATYAAEVFDFKSPSTNYPYHRVGFRFPEHFLGSGVVAAYDGEAYQLEPKTRPLAVEIMQAWIIQAHHRFDTEASHSLAKATCSFAGAFPESDFTFDELGIPEGLYADNRDFSRELSNWRVTDEAIASVEASFMNNAALWLQPS